MEKSTDLISFAGSATERWPNLGQQSYRARLFDKHNVSTVDIHKNLFNTGSLRAYAKGESESRGIAKKYTAYCSDLEYLPTETVRMWWAAKIVSIKENYFVSEAFDSNNNKSFIEFNFDDAFSSDEDKKLYLRLGSKFTFFVLRKHSKSGSPSTVSKIEFIPPYLWTEKDEESVSKMVEELFPSDFLE